MINDSALSLSALEALETSLPASPRDISPDTTLPDLEAIRCAWLEQARTQGLPERLFGIGYWLGSQAPDNRGMYRLYTLGNLRIWATVKHGAYNIPTKSWNTIRRVMVYLDAEQHQQVTDWQWYYFSQSLEETPADPQEGLPDELLFIPGEWVTRALEMHPKAERTRIGIAHSADVDAGRTGQAVAGGEVGLMFPNARWFSIPDGSPHGRWMLNRHYSRNHYLYKKPKLFCGPGYKVILETSDGLATFIWRKFIDKSGQVGINCAMFRNEGPELSSSLILEAEQIAWGRWPGERLYTYINPKKIRSTNPGYCFLMAGWKKCGYTKGGLVILEKTHE